MVCCVVLNWNGWQDTLVCLRSLENQTHQPLHVLVVDNGSTNDSVEHIREFIAVSSGPSTFTLMETGANLGFAKGNNVGVREALRLGCEYVWVLNNDTECPPDTLEKLVRTAEANPQAGIIGTVLLYHHDPSKVQAWSGGRINRWTGTSRHYVGPTPQIRGSYVTLASALVRAEVFREVGLLYEGVFMYYEDTDFGVRMEDSRWKIAVAEDTAVLHKESASSDGPRNPFMEKTKAVSGLRFLRRHSPFPPFSLPIFIAIKLINRVRRGEWEAARAVLRGVGEYSRSSIPE
jgi:GT2 family glycosyltransferase